MSGENFRKCNGKSLTTVTALRTHRRLWQAALMLVPATAACGSTASSNAQTATPPFAVREVAKFSTPWAIDFLPGSGVALTKMALVTEKDGKLWLVDTATGQKQAVAGVPSVYVAGQGGLGDVVVHPGFAGNQRVYLSFVEQGEGGSGAALGYGRLVMGQGAPRIEGFQDHLAAVAEGVGQWSLQPSHRIRP